MFSASINFNISKLVCSQFSRLPQHTLFARTPPLPQTFCISIVNLVPRVFSLASKRGNSLNETKALSLIPLGTFVISRSNITEKREDHGDDVEQRHKSRGKGKQGVLTTLRLRGRPGRDGCQSALWDCLGRRICRHENASPKTVPKCTLKPS